MKFYVRNLISAFLFLSLFGATQAFALEDPGPETEEETTVEKKSEGKGEPTSRDLRGFSQWGIHGQLSTASLIVPLKPGLSLSWNPSPSWTLEAGVLRGSLSAGIAGQDIGSYTETSYQLNARYFGKSNSFNFLMGVSHEKGALGLGNKYVNFATGFGDIDVASLNSYAVSFGWGNRWQWGNKVSFGVDWLTITVPVKTGNTSSDFFASNASAEDKKKVQDILDFFAKVPRFSICHLTVGYNF